MKLVPFLLVSVVMLGRADAFTFNFAGVINSVTPAVWGSPALVGTTFTAFIIVNDSFAPTDANADPNQGFYYINPPPMGVKPLHYGISLSNGLNLTDYTPVASIVWTQNLLTGDSLTLDGECNWGAGNGLLRFTFLDLTGQALTSDSWTTNYSSPFWQSITVDFQTTTGDGARFSGAAAIPEGGGSGWLLGLGIFGLFLYQLVCAWTFRSRPGARLSS